MLENEVFVQGIMDLKASGLPGGDEFSDKKTELWRKALEDLSNDEFTIAVDRAIQECEFFPTVAVLRRLSGKKEEKCSGEGSHMRDGVCQWCFNKGFTTAGEAARRLKDRISRALPPKLKVPCGCRSGDAWVEKNQDTAMKAVRLITQTKKAVGYP